MRKMNRMDGTYVEKKNGCVPSVVNDRDSLSNNSIEDLFSFAKRYFQNYVLDSNVLHASTCYLFLYDHKKFKCPTDKFVSNDERHPVT